MYTQRENSMLESRTFICSDVKHNVVMHILSHIIHYTDIRVHKIICKRRGEASKTSPRPKLAHFVFLEYHKNRNLITKSANVVSKLR